MLALAEKSVNWNIFRYVADYLHFGGMISGLVVIGGTRSVDGFSGKTQVLYQLVYFCRYLDVFTDQQSTYLIFFKITFQLVTAVMLGFFWAFRHTYDAAADSCNLLAILLPVSTASLVFGERSGFKEDLWTFSEFLEPFALMPQYIVCYRAKRVRPGALLYVFAVGGYRVLYVCNWIYKRYMLHGAYHDYTSWLGGAVECMLFVDFVSRIAQRRDVIEASGIGKFLLKMDENAGRLSEKVEMSALGRRLPLGVSGSSGQDNGRSWNSADRMTDEEGAKLMTLDADADSYY
eukprot:TRINITY_DN81881_c0_g1_i1.p1 TRINITY_DN81881_c0_g1~~TRINITY_DN81881_c0_g1_i1.p1  ORF type:complete len:290 (-),score=68.37 TRINITY_DN81881_c0_g1_i1:28-897(-)